MPYTLIQNSTRPLQKPIRVKYCRDFLSRFRGLMLRAGIDPQEGILLVENRDSRMDTAIHMLFMRFDIAAIWINSEMLVVDVRLARKWQPVITPAQPARFVLEAHPQQVTSFAVGDRVEFVDA